MKSDLEILIEHLQSEVDYLKLSMDQCVADWDFDGAKSFREPLNYTKRKLRILQSLDNPNYGKISRLISLISVLEKNLNVQDFKIGHLEEQARLQMLANSEKVVKNRIEQARRELKILEAIIPKQRTDNDKLLELLDSLVDNKTKLIEFEVRKDKVFL